jgi:transmembrane sensor
MIGQTRHDPRREAAVDWFYRRQAGPLSDADAQAFSEWLAEPANRDAYLAVEAFWAGAAQAQDLPRFDAKRDQILKDVNRQRVTRRAGAASLVALVAVIIGGGVYQVTAPKALVTQSFHTAVGQQATVVLPDGSKITLNTDTVVRTRADGERRLVYLDKGQAFFRVAHDRRHPFVVTAAGRTVTALGTQFDVRVESGALKVLLVEGKVRVQTAPAPAPAPGGAPAAPTPLAARSTDMEPGSEFVALTDGDWRMSRVNVERETSWLHGKIVIDDRPLGEVVAELNRYSQHKMVIEDDGLAKVRLSGIYQPGDAKEFADSLRFAGVAKMQQGADGSLRIVPLDKKNPPAG